MAPPVLTVDSALSDWLLASSAKTKQATTDHKRVSAQRFLQFMTETTDHEPTLNDISRRTLPIFATWLQQSPVIANIKRFRQGQAISKGTQHGTLRDIGNFLRWCLDQDLFDKPIVLPHGRDYLPRVPRDVLDTPAIAEVHKLLQTVSASVSGSKSLISRNRALLWIMLDSGLRLGEILRLDLNDYDRLRGRLMVRNSKGGDSREVYLGPDSRQALESYIRKPRLLLVSRRGASDYMRKAYIPAWEAPNDNREYPVSGDSVEPALFVTRSGRRMTPSLVHKFLSDLCRDAGIKRYMPHSLRRFYATQAAASNAMSLITLKEQLGHANLATTQRYLAHNPESQQREAIAASPLSAILRGRDASR
jgi:site-specific recombinase XerD